jgi:energy-coupling factor transporter ATP-binding protein EcfA2
MPNADPIAEVGERKILNSWVPPKLHPKAGTWPTIKRIVEFVTDGNGTAEAWLLNWMAFVVQYPGEQPGTAVVLVGEQGIGKSILAGLLRKMVGEENSCTIGQRDLESAFNGHYAGKLLVIGEEVATSENRRHVAGYLKQCIGDPRVTVNIKGIQNYEIPNRAAYWFNTNSTRPVDFEEGERHYSLICSRVSGVERNPELRALFEGCFEGGSFTPGFQEEVQAFFCHLKSLKVDVNLVRHVLLSKDREVLIDACRPSAMAFIAELQERGVDEVLQSYSTQVADEWKAAEGVPTKVVYEAYVSWCKANGFQFPVSKMHLGAELHRQAVDNRRRGTGCRPYYYVFPESWMTPAATVPGASVQEKCIAVGQQSLSVTGSAAQGDVEVPSSTLSVSDAAPKSDEEKEREWLELIGETPAQKAVA